MLVRVVLAVDDPRLRREFRVLLDQRDVTVETIRAKRFPWARLRKTVGDVFVISEDLIPEPVEDSVSTLGQLPDLPEIVVLTEAKAPEKQASLLAAGCAAVFYSGLPAESLGEALTTVVEKRLETMGRIAPKWVRAEPRLADFLGDSPIMHAFMNIVRRVVRSDVPLLIQGETGVGKERLARAIHAEGHRASGPFVAVNCGALPEALLESELFGHAEGAFTGATRSRRGWFELGHGGTVFLDEIGELPYHLQVKLLRVLQDHEVQPVGSEKAIQVDVRVIAATNSDLEEEVEAKRFRRDLFHRLNVVTLSVPPLRERLEDIPRLVHEYIQYFQNQIDRTITKVSDEAIQAFRDYDWPGNVRELMNVIERAMLLCESSEITLTDLPQSIASRTTTSAEGKIPAFAAASSKTLGEDWLRKPLKDVREAFIENLERRYLEGLLRETCGRIGETARRAGIKERSLYDKMKRHGLRKEDFRHREASP